MKINTGTDIVSVQRIKDSVLKCRSSKKSRSFIKRYFGLEEQILFEEINNTQNKMERIAANFAGKEAFAKAIGTGFRGFSLSQVQILRDDLGAPYLRLDEKVLLIVGKDVNFSLSLAHTAEYATAVVIMYE